MEKYGSYKDSGVGWIGEIPSSYSLLPIKYILKDIVDNRGRNPELEDEGVPYIEVKHVNINGKYPTQDTDRFISNDTYNNFLRDYLEEGDVLYTTVGTLGRTSIIPKNFNGCIIQNVVGFRTNEKCDSTFFYYVLNSEFGQHLIYDVVRGNIQGSIKVTDFIQQKIITPPLSEQQQIVSFLDTKTSLIDSLIEKTQRKIELLKEKRTSLINEVVTKGLNPKVEMKDSGVEWIGEIPSHWEFIRLNNLGDFSKGKGITKDKIKESGHKCIRCGEIYTTYELRFNKTNSFIDDETSSESVLSFKGVLLFTGDGESLEEIGKCVVYEGEEELYIGGGINVFTPKQEKVIPVYLSYVMSSESVIFQKSRQGKGEIVVHIYSKQLKEIRLGLPPFSEQQQIVEFLDEQTGLIDNTISNEEKRIELLKEYRQSLISEVVTGKRKVV